MLEQPAFYINVLENFVEGKQFVNFVQCPVQILETISLLIQNNWTLKLGLSLRNSQLHSIAFFCLQDSVPGSDTGLEDSLLPPLYLRFCST